MKRSTRSLMTAAAVVGMVALMTEAAAAQTPAPQLPHVGTYDLVSIDDDDLPAVVERSTDCVEEVTAASLVLGPDWTYRIEVSERETCGEDVEEDTETESGTYTMDGATLVFEVDEDPDEETAEIEVDQLVSATIDGSMLHAKVHGSDAMIMLRKR
jgi:hypothetical protein